MTVIQERYQKTFLSHDLPRHKERWSVDQWRRRTCGSWWSTSWPNQYRDDWILILKLDNQFFPKKNKDQMSEMKQQSDERMTYYCAKVRDIVRKCNCRTYKNNAMIQTMNNDKLRSIARRENWTSNWSMYLTKVGWKIKQFQSKLMQDYLDKTK